MADVSLPVDVPTCKTCRYHKPDERPEYQGAGLCRRFPPKPTVWTMTGHDLPSQPGYEQHFPWMAADEWCGEYVRRPDPFHWWVSENQDAFVKSGTHYRWVMNEIICDKSLQGETRLFELSRAIAAKGDAPGFGIVFSIVRDLLTAWGASA